MPHYLNETPEIHRIYTGHINQKQGTVQFSVTLCDTNNAVVIGTVFHPLNNFRSVTLASEH